MTTLRPWSAAIAALALAALACTTLTRLPQRLSQRQPGAAPTAAIAPATPAPSGGNSLSPRPTATEDTGGALSPQATPTEDQTSTVPPVEVPGGPTIGGDRETRTAFASANAQFLDAAAQEQYTPAELNKVGARLTYTIQVDTKDQQLLWGYGWCATTAQIRDDNLSKMKLEFSVNGQPVEVTQFQVAEGPSQDGKQQCRQYVAVVYGWPSGKTTLVTKITYNEKINDGTSDYAAGDQIFTYNVTAP